MADTNRVDDDFDKEADKTGEEHTGSSQTNTPGGAVPGAQGAQDGAVSNAVNNGGAPGSNTSGNAGQ